MPRHTARRLQRVRRRAFTLIEASLATVIVGVGVLAIVEAQQTFLQKNAWSTHTSTAMFLANEIREMTRNMPRHDRFSGGLYFLDPASHTGFVGWGPETDEISALDYDDLDDFDGVAFGTAPNLPGGLNMRFTGPVNALGEVAPDIAWDGSVVVDANGDPLPLQGWTQFIQVDKVDPYDFTTAIPDEYFEPAAGIDPEVEVDRFPVRVTVTILYQGFGEATATTVAQVAWIVPAI
jgi:type II secretory pathway pseudopilin PulG